MSKITKWPEKNFYPRPPRGGRRIRAAWAFSGGKISIHALREEGDAVGAHVAFHKGISIHALREEGDTTRPPGWYFPAAFLSTPPARRATHFNTGDKIDWIFLSTPSARRATQLDEVDTLILQISIHALCEEGDSPIFGIQYSHARFLSTPSARRATPDSTVAVTLLEISIHALCEEGDYVQVY